MGRPFFIWAFEGWEFKRASVIILDNPLNLIV